MSAITRHDPRKVDAWIAALREAGAKRWQLLQLAGRGRASMVRRFGEVEAAADTFAKDVVGVCQQDADDTAPGVTTTYALVALDDEGGELGRYTVRASGRARDVNDAGPEEDPTIAGLVGQLLRHEEARARFRFGLASEVAEGYAPLVLALQKQVSDQQRELEARAARILALERRVDETIDIRADLADRKAENDLKLRAQAASHERLGKMLGMAFMLLPTLLAKRGASTGLDTEVAAFVATIEPEQLPKLAAALKPEQQIVLASILKKYVPEPATTAAPAASPTN